MTYFIVSFTLIFIVMTNIIKNVLNKIIVSRYPELSDVEVKENIKEGIKTFKVMYLVNGSISYDNAYDIIRETESLSKMVNPDLEHSIIVSFGKSPDYSTDSI